jgi:hypothetical protein
MSNLTKAQTNALLAALQNGSAHMNGVRKKNGANMRMITRMAAAGLLTEDAPYAITEKGKQALRDAGKLKDQKKFRINHQGEIWTIVAPTHLRGAPVTFAIAKQVVAAARPRVSELV